MCYEDVETLYHCSNFKERLYPGSITRRCIVSIGVLYAVLAIAGCATTDQQKIPEPASWSFPDVIKSARAISPRNVEGIPFNKSGLAYPRSMTRSLDIANMSPEELQKYADIVTHAYPDAVFQPTDSPEEVRLDKMNEISYANNAYISLHAINPDTRKRAATRLRVLQERLRKKGSE